MATHAEFFKLWKRDRIFRVIEEGTIDEARKVSKKRWLQATSKSVPFKPHEQARSTH
jgi:hypothetical protein